jgi:hypothetical protein
MDGQRLTYLRALGAGLVFLTAAYHLWWGFPRSLVYGRVLGAYIQQGLWPDPRPFLFVVLGILLLAGPYFITRNVVSLKRGYLGAIVVLALSVLAWLAWHETGHGAFLTGATVPDTGHHDSTSILHTIASHYVIEPVEGAIKSIEIAAIGVFAYLLKRDPACRDEE